MCRGSYYTYDNAWLRPRRSRSKINSHQDEINPAAVDYHPCTVCARQISHQNQVRLTRLLLDYRLQYFPLQGYFAASEVQI
jgi:hypothetical protein